jgi:hypothetical protein
LVMYVNPAYRELESDGRPVTGVCVIVSLMRRIAPRALVLTCASQFLVWGQVSSHCLQYGRPVSILGTLARIDENGYRRWIALRPLRPICILADPSDEFSDAIDDVSQLQTFVADDAKTVDSRLERLIGKNAVVTGKLTQWHTGYQRAELVFDVQAVQAVDATGEADLRTPDPPKAVVREVSVYDVSVRAGESLAKETRELATGKVLEPVDEYSPHWVTGGDVVYVNCRDGYRRKLISSTDKQSISDDDDVGFGFNAYPAKPLVLRFRCIRADR